MIINIVPVILVFFGWSIESFFYYYILESIVIGIFTIVQFVSASAKPTWNQQTGKKNNPVVSIIVSIFFSLWFVVHFGGIAMLLFWAISSLL